MISRMFAASLTTFVLFLPKPTIPQQGSDVTFTMPVNLTHLSPDIGKIQVYCTISSNALLTKVTGQQDIVVSGGQVVMTATIVVPVRNLTNPVGQIAGYFCRLLGFSTSLQQWGAFDPAATVAAFRLSPAPAVLTGTFTW